MGRVEGRRGPRSQTAHRRTCIQLTAWERMRIGVNTSRVTMPSPTIMTPPVLPSRIERRRAAPPAASVLPRHRCARLAALLVGCSCLSAPLAAQSGPVPDVDLFALSSARANAALPAGWQTRAVRGQRLPMSQIIDTSGIRYMRVRGQGQAGWFVRELPVPLLVSAGRLHWTWRAPLAPRGASVAAAATDDAAVRVFVVFGGRRGFMQRPRVLFYTLADGEAMPDRSDSPFGVRIAGRPELAHDWVGAVADPFLDYRRIWGSAPPPIVAVGVMQDTDQTRSAAIGDVRHLHWRSSNVALP